MGISVASRNFTNTLITSEQQKIPSISSFDKLLFTHIIKSPWFLKTISISLFFVPFAYFDLCSDILLPLITCFLILRLKLEFTIKTFDF